MLAGFGPQYGLSEELAKRVARSLGGGMNQGMPCGAVLGAYMILGLSEEDPDLSRDLRRERVDSKIMKLKKLFSEKHGTVVCQELLGINPWSKQGQEAARDQKLFTVKCPAFVQDAALILEKLLAAE